MVLTVQIPQLCLVEEAHHLPIVDIVLFGPFIFTEVIVKEKTNNTVRCLTQLGLMPFQLTVSLVIVLK